MLKVNEPQEDVLELFLKAFLDNPVSSPFACIPLFPVDNVSLNRLHVLKSCLMSALPSSVTVADPALDVLALLRILHSLNFDWTAVFDVSL